MDSLNKELIGSIPFKASRLFSVFFLVLFLLFFFCSVYSLMLVSLLCAGLCAASLPALHRDLTLAHFSLLYAAVLLETVAAVLLLGWDGYFQLALPSLVLLSFFGEYIGRTLKRPYLPGLPLSLLAAFVYFLLQLVSTGHASALSVSAGTLRLFRVFWGLESFGFVILCMHLFVHLTTHSEKVLTDKASVDKLTGLLNRAGYDRTLAEMELDKTILLLFDTDKFKNVNDTYGHETGDRVLVSIAKSIRQNFRAEDRVCRIGGDEFVVLMLNVEGDQRELIRRKVNRINRELAHPEDKLPIVSLSVGVAFGADEPDAETLFAHADESLYRVKQAGGRDCIFYGD